MWASGHAHVVEGEGGVVAAVERSEATGERHAGRVGVDDHHRRATSVDLDEHGQEVDLGTARHVRLAAVDDQLVAVDPRPGGAGGVGRLGEGEPGPLLPRQQRRQVGAAQRLAHLRQHPRPGPEQPIEVPDAVARQRVPGDDQRQRRLGELVGPTRLREVEQPGRPAGRRHPLPPLDPLETGVVPQPHERPHRQLVDPLPQLHQLSAQQLRHARTLRPPSSPTPAPPRARPSRRFDIDSPHPSPKKCRRSPTPNRSSSQSPGFSPAEWPVLGPSPPPR